MANDKQKIIKILEENNFIQDNVQEIILKSKERAIVSIAVEKVNSDQSKIAKAAKNSEKEIAKRLGFEKVTIVLSVGEVNKASAKKTKTKAQKKQKAPGILAKLKDVLRKKPQKQAKKAPEKQLPSNQGNQGNKGDPNNPKKLKNVKKIIAIASAKGGVGKSTLSANIAITLARIGQKVALVDADIYGPSIANIMNFDDKPLNKNNMIIPHEKYGVKFISVANLIDKNAAGVWRAAMINKILNQLMVQVDWAHDGNDIDVMIIDMPPGTGDIYLSLAQNFELDGAILVSTPQNLAQIDLVRSIDCFNKLNVNILGLIENMSYFTEKDGEKNYIFGKGNLKEFAKEQNIDLLGQIEIIKELGDNVQDKIPLSYDQPSHNFSHQIGMICEDVIL